MKLNRRDFLKLSTAATVTAAGGFLLNQLPNWQDGGFTIHSVARAASIDFEPDVEIRLHASPDSMQILPGQPTSVWHYSAEVLLGDAAAVQTIPDSYLGPIIRVRQGQKVRIIFQNDLPEQSNIHWHGLYVPDYADGHPRFIAQPGESYVYEFEVKNRAGTYWYHPHPHERTGAQVYAGLAGLFIVEDDGEDALGLPSGEYDLPLVIQDRTFTGSNQFQYVTTMHDRVNGFWADTMLVNGQSELHIPVATRPYRLRVLNGSNARIYVLALSDESPLRIIGTDGGLLNEAVLKPYVTLAPAERVEFWVDFSSYDIGTQIKLTNIAGSQPVDLATFTIDEASNVRSEPPTALRDIERLDPEQAVNATSPKVFEFSMSRMTPTINNRTFEMDRVADNEIARVNTVEIWEFRNSTQSGGMMAMPHPVHMHGRQFQVIERSVHPSYAGQWDDLTAGYINDGWKDTVLLMPGESVKVAVPFDEYEGLFLYHCHVLEHEDLGMMRNYEVRA